MKYQIWQVVHLLFAFLNTGRKGDTKVNRVNIYLAIFHISKHLPSPLSLISITQSFFFFFFWRVYIISACSFDKQHIVPAREIKNSLVQVKLNRPPRI